MQRPETERVYIIDLLRFIAAIGVVLYHLSYRMPTIDHMGGGPFPEIDWWTRYTHMGVELFFMISGFVIAFSAQGKTAAQFVWSRFVRLYPTYWLCVILTFAVCHYFWRPHFDLTLAQGLVNLTMLQSFFRVPPVDWPYWTLAEELRFYGLMFILLLLRQSHRLLAFVAVWMAICTVDLFIHIPLAHYEMTLEHAPFFAAGVVYFDAFKRGFRPSHYALGLVTFVLGAVHFLRWSAMDAKETGAYCSPSVIFAVLVALHVLFWLIATRRLIITQRHHWITVAGGITYPLYLLHDRIGMTVMLTLTPTLGRWWALVMTCVGACVLAYAVWRWWELPLTAWLRSLGSRRESVGTGLLEKVS
jgi:peptidoglycan/LPS O-acetylase OafA/YrhL